MADVIPATIPPLANSVCKLDKAINGIAIFPNPDKIAPSPPIVVVSIPSEVLAASDFSANSATLLVKSAKLLANGIIYSLVESPAASFSLSIAF